MRGLFFQNKKEYTSQSISKITWDKFKKNRQGNVLSVFLILLIVLAALGYLITPDQSPHANEQLLEIRLQKPDSQMTLLHVRKNQEVKKVNVLDRKSVV